MEITDWRISRSTPKQFLEPSELDDTRYDLNGLFPSTIAQTLKASARTADNIDQYDWWFRTEFRYENSCAQTLMLHFEGLATIAEVWLNGEPILTSENMFLAQCVSLGVLDDRKNRLDIVFRSVFSACVPFRGRPKWKTNLVKRQNLRWIRTSLLGYIPGWTQAYPAIGPWRPVHVLPKTEYYLKKLKVIPALNGESGEIKILGELWQDPSLKFDPTIEFFIESKTFTLKLGKPVEGYYSINESIKIPSPRKWWPHTHGDQNLYQYQLKLGGTGANSLTRNGNVGFKSLALLNTKNDIQCLINNEEIFCRGSCWTIGDACNFQSENLPSLLGQFVDAGMNMIRVGGTMVYENDEFYGLCDKLGIMVWQDFMFANMDYPVEDQQFRENIREEVRHQVRRLSEYCCITIFCGNSEVEQQAAMMGCDPDEWRNEFFACDLAEICKESIPNAGYFPSSPCYGDLPFQPDVGLAHYFGVGAYLRELDDIWVSDIKFSPECLGFSNIPDERTLIECFDCAAPPVHTPAWKAGVPRDNVAGWDFEDVRDFYTEKLFGEDILALRYSKNQKYFKLSKLVTGELMSRLFATWRSSLTSCRGALTWFYKDIIPGAGWGLIDSFGRPKPAWYILRRCLQPEQVLMINKGLSGHIYSVINETENTKRYKLSIDFCSSGVIVQSFNTSICVNARSEIQSSLANLANGFQDTTFSYRFGEKKYDAIFLSLKNDDSSIISRYVDFPGLIPTIPNKMESILVDLIHELGNDYLVLTTDSPVYFVELSSKSISLFDNYVHLLPGEDYKIKITIDPGVTKVRGSLSAINSSNSVRFVCEV
ncbi:glycosyl hydrolase 2 galactose-binding domain-containing protein [Teredinibacter haidensis]|uniref:glycosyl hydrolase 2 galactose-binding domain-containing protein n=1 Tax=Teredinibacter haidensis TaxID=2731755 RepID=UPI000948D420|nr:hypothetical protein [Teredinibacter haidensis]